MSEEKEPIINGIDVSECSYYNKDNEPYCCEVWDNECEAQNCYFKQLKRLQEENEELKTYIQKMDKPEIKTIDSEIVLKNIELQQENEKIKKQYNCYACGNCNGKEDYINLEKHHKGLRKQFDELAKRNNTLSLRIEELEKDNEKLKQQIKKQKNAKIQLKNLDSRFAEDYCNVKEENKNLQKENEKLKENQCCPETCEYIATEIIRYTDVCEVNSKYKQALEKIRNIAEKLITETPEYNSCYYKDECGDNCTPKKQSKVQYCCYENVDKILTIINEVIK